MAKIITAHRLEGEVERAREYVRVHIVFPAALLGLVFLVAGSAAIGYQFLAKSYGWATFLQSSGLLVAGALLGWGQTKYHQYLLREHPSHFATRMKLFEKRSSKASRRDAGIPTVEHPGRSLVPLGYLLGMAMLLGLAGLCAMYGEVYYVAAFLLPWAGFFWAKTFFWRRLIGGSQGRGGARAR